MSESAMRNGDLSKDDPGGGGADCNGTEETDAEAFNVSPEMLFKISKKIAQLTKVIYSLNTHNDDLELELESLRAGKANNSTASGSDSEKSVPTTPEATAFSQQQQHPLAEAASSKKRPAENGDSETRKELRRAKHIMRQLEAKMKAMEEENERRAKAQQSKSDEKEKAKPSEKQELTRRLDQLEMRNEHLELEVESLQRERSKLQLDLSALRVQAKYASGSVVNSVLRSQSLPAADEDSQLAHKVEELTREKAELMRQLHEARQRRPQVEKEAGQSEAVVSAAVAEGNDHVVQRLRSEAAGLQTALEEQRTRHDREMIDLRSQLLESQQSNMTLRAARDAADEAAAREMRTLREDKRKVQLEAEQARLGQEAEMKALRGICDRREDELKSLRAEVSQIKCDLNEAAEAQRKAVSDLVAQVRRRDGDVERARDDLAAVQAQLSAAKTSLAREQADRDRASRDADKERAELRQAAAKMGQTSEALVSAQERCKSMEKERDELKRKCNEIEARMDVMNKSTGGDDGGDEKVSSLEKALQESLAERQEILQAAALEIENEKTIALEREQSMMDDFEWKLREIESEYKKKLKETEQAVETKVKELSLKKDAELTRMSMTLRREMEEKHRASAVDKASNDNALEKLRLEKESEIRKLKMSWDEERSKLARENRTLQRQKGGVSEEIAAVSRQLRQEHDAVMFEERRKAAKAAEASQDAYDHMRDELNGQMARMRVEYGERIQVLEERLENANSNRFSSMFEMREMVETEFSERMEQLSAMYRGEVESLTARLEAEKERTGRQEAALRNTITDLRKEADELNAYYAQHEEQYENKVTDLLTRLQEQTSRAQKLQQELDDCEWYEEDEENEARPASAHHHPKAGRQHTSLHNDTMAHSESDPFPPPRKEKPPMEESASALSVTKSAREQSPPNSTCTFAPPPPPPAPHKLCHSATLPAASATALAKTRPPGGATLSRLLHLQSPKTKKRSSSSNSGRSSKSNCTQQ